MSNTECGGEGWDWVDALDDICENKRSQIYRNADDELNACLVWTKYMESRCDYSIYEYEIIGDRSCDISGKDPSDIIKSNIII